MFDYVYNYFFSSNLGMLELVASILTLICVWQVARQNIWNFLWGGIAVIIFGYIFYMSKLYPDSILQFGYYLPMSVFGWWYWYTQGGPKPNTLPLISAKPHQWLIGGACVLVGSAIVGHFFATFTDAALPYPDSFILVSSIFAQYLLSKKYVESWVLWISVDVVAVPVYYVKELYVTSGLYVILLCLATYGFFSWFNGAKVVKFGRPESRANAR